MRRVVRRRRVEFLEPARPGAAAETFVTLAGKSGVERGSSVGIGPAEGGGRVESGRTTLRGIIYASYIRIICTGIYHDVYPGMRYAGIYG